MQKRALFPTDAITFLPVRPSVGPKNTQMGGRTDGRGRTTREGVKNEGPPRRVGGKEVRKWPEGTRRLAKGFLLLLHPVLVPLFGK